MKRFIVVALTIALFLFGAQTAVSETVTPTATATPAVTPVPTGTPDEWLQQWYQIGDLLRKNGNYPFSELRRGDQSFEVKALQARLSELGYYKKEIVDVFGKGTYSALRAFEKANDLKVDGIASAADQKALFADTAVAAEEAKSTSESAAKSSSGSGGGGNTSDATSGATT